VTIPVNEVIKFVNEHSQLVLEIEGEATTEGTRADQYTDTGRDHQRWRLKPAGPGNEGFYNIENVHSTMSLEVVGYSQEPGAEIVQRPYGDGPLHRQWKLVPVPGKTDVYKIENRNSGLILDDVDGQTDAPAPVKRYGSWDDDGRQQWKLIRVVANTSVPPVVTPPSTTPPATTPPATIRPLIDLNGRWTVDGNPGYPAVVISVASTSISFDMSAYNRPNAYGSFVDSSTIKIIFPDIQATSLEEKTYTGRLERPNVIRWPGSIWKKL
jgi:ricin-type beta-trefoil lectin protein